MKYSIPGHLLDAMLRHYGFLAGQQLRERTAKTMNAKRMARIEIQKTKSIMEKQKALAK